MKLPVDLLISGLSLLVQTRRNDGFNRNQQRDPGFGTNTDRIGHVKRGRSIDFPTQVPVSFISSQHKKSASILSSTVSLATATQSISSVEINNPNDEINNKYERLFNWLKSNDDVYINEKIKLLPSKRGGGYGAFIIDDDDNTQDMTTSTSTTTDDIVNEIQSKQDTTRIVIQENELLFTIPRSLCITINDALQDNEVGEGFKTLLDRAGPGGNTVVLAGYVASEWLKCNPNLVPTDTGTSTNNNNDVSIDPTIDTTKSIYGPYLAALPWSRGVNNQEHILYWTNDEIETILEGSMCYGEALDLRKEVTIATKIINTIISRAREQTLIKQRQNGIVFPWQSITKKGDELPTIPGLSQEICASFVCLLTRAFEDDDYDDDTTTNDSNTDKEKLVPLLDMLQHSDTPNVIHSMIKKNNGAIEVRARVPLMNGDELLNQYRSELEETMPYHRFFTRFGFVPGISESLVNLFNDKSSIFFAQKAEV